MKIFEVIKNKPETNFKLGSKLPWHSLVRPNLKISIKYFRSFITVRLRSDSQKDVEITFNKDTGYVHDVSRQICSMWTVDTLKEMSESVSFAYNTIVRFGIQEVGVKKK